MFRVLLVEPVMSLRVVLNFKEAEFRPTSRAFLV
jgi:hypothetical protein